MTSSDYPLRIAPLSAEDGGGFIAVALDLPGCMSDGETPEEALRNGYDAIESWLAAAQAHGIAIPPPSAALKSA